MSICSKYLAAIENLGYSPTEATFLYLVATHSGYFTRNQFLRYTGFKKGCLVHRLTSRTIDLKHARVKQYGQTHIYHLFSRQIYGVIDKDNLRNRRDLSKELIRSRLLILDFILDHPDFQYLETESDKVNYFHNAVGVPITALPSRTYKSLKADSQTVRYFVDRFPIFLTSEATITPTFVYSDSDLPGLFSFVTHLRNYEELFRRLPACKLIYASQASPKSQYAQRVFNRMFAAQATDATKILRYFRVRRLWENRQTESLTRTDRDVLREGDRTFQGQMFHQLYQQWASETISDGEIEYRFGTILANSAPQFETCLLPESYAIFLQVTGAPIRPSAEFRRSSVRSSLQIAATEAKCMKEQGF